MASILMDSYKHLYGNWSLSIRFEGGLYRGRDLLAGELGDFADLAAHDLALARFALVWC